MTLIQWQKERPARTLVQAGDLFTDIFNDFNTFPSARWNTPAVNIVEDDTSYRIDLAVPGFPKEDLKIQIDENVLICSAEKIEIGSHQEKYSRKEFSFGAFTRRFNLPENVNTDLIKAGYKNGIMSIRLPKKAEEKPRSKSISID